MTEELKSTALTVVPPHRTVSERKGDILDNLLTALETISVFGAAMTPQQATAVNALAHAIHWMED